MSIRSVASSNAVEHLHSRLIVVLGHTKCGAVGAAVVGGHAAGRIPSIVEMIAPSVAEAQKLGGDVAAKAVELNARRMAGILRQVQPVLSKEVAAGNLKIVSGCLDITTGQVKITE